MKQIINCDKCGKKMIKKKSNHKFCSKKCSSTFKNKENAFRLDQIKLIANDIIKGRRRRSYLTSLGLSSTDKQRVNNFIKAAFYGR